MHVKQPNFFLRKPDTLSLLYRLDEESKNRDKQQMTVTMLAGFRLEPEPVLLEEGDFWQPVKELEGVPFDLGMPKPAGEFLIAADCHAPDNQSTLACPVKAKVGGRTKNLVVIGDRWWTSNDKVTFPVPFKKMELGWERSFGGASGYDNPAGRGMVPVRCLDGRRRKPLPNIQHPDRLIGSPLERQRPAGFGPEGLDWPSRRALVGSLDKNWLARRWPKPPANASPRLFHMASPDQRFSGFLQGDEQVLLHNMHPERSRIESQLPGRRCRCFLGNHSAENTFVEMQCRLDTLWLFPGHETGILIWRAGLTGLPEWDTDAYYLAASLEPLAEPPEKARTCYAGIIGLSDATAEEIPVDASEPEPDPPQKANEDVTAEAQDTALKFDPVAATIAEKTAAAKAKLTPLLAAFGISADELLGQSAAAAQAGKGTKPLTPARLAQRSAHLHKKLDTMLLRTGLTPKDLQPDTIIAQAGKPGQKNRSARIATAIAAMKSYGIEDDALFAEMKLLEQQADKVSDEQRQQKRSEKPNSNLPSRAVMTREEVLAAYTAGNSLAGLDLSGLDLSGQMLDRADFRGAVLEGVNFSKTSLRGADCSGALLSRADCSGSVLTGIHLQDCVATAMLAVGADLTGADLCKARFDKSDFSRACFAESKAVQAKFDACMLTEVDARKADLHRAGFKGADLTAIRCADADLRRADFNRALLDRADFRSSNLEGAWFTETEGEEVIFCEAKLSRSKCNLTSLPGADFSEAEMGQLAWSESIFPDACLRHGMLDRAMLTNCDFQRADFSRTSLRQANLMHSDLRQTSLYKANAFKARFRHARLEGSNCCDANFYGADLYKTALRHTLLNGTNLDATLFAIKLPV